MAIEFGRAVMIIDAEDAALQKTLTNSEKKVTSSVNRMQGQFNKLKVATQSTASGLNVLDASAVTAQSSMMVLSQAAAATGSIALTTAANVGILTFSLRGLAVGTIAATVAARGMVLAVAGSVLGITAAIAAYAIYTIKIRAARKELDALTESEKLLEHGITKREALVNRIKSQEATLKKQIFTARGGSESAFLLAEQAGGQRGLGRIIALTQELELITRQKNAEADRIRGVERLVALKKQQLETERRIADEIEKESRASRRARLFGGAGATNAQEGRAQLLNAGMTQFKQDVSQQFILRAASNLLRQGTDAGRISQMLQNLGIRLGEAAAAPRSGQTGALGLSAFASSGRGASLGVIRSGEQQKTERRDVERNTLLKDIKGLMALLGGRSPLGIGD